MLYSKFITSLCDNYNIKPNDVMFALLVAAGCSEVEAYAHTFRFVHLSEEKICDKLKSYKKSVPGVLSLLLYLSNKRGAHIAPPLPSLPTSGTTGAVDVPRGWDENLTDTENLEKIIKDEIPKLEGKDKINTALSFVKLRGVDVEKKERLFFYLPLRCDRCKFRILANDK